MPLLSDWNGEAIRAFDVAFEPLGMNDVAIRSAFLIRDGKSIEAAWLLGADLPDIDAVLAAARGLATSAGDAELPAGVAPAEPERQPAHERIEGLPHTLGVPVLPRTEHSDGQHVTDGASEETTFDEPSVTKGSDMRYIAAAIVASRLGAHPTHPRTPSARSPKVRRRPPSPRRARCLSAVEGRAPGPLAPRGRGRESVRARA